MKFHIQRPGIRYTTKLAPLWMRVNQWEGKCWCGRPKSLWAKWQRKYCCAAHGWWHYSQIKKYWVTMREEIHERDKGICQMCFKDAGIDYDCDHILAISLGGEMFDEDNLRTLCNPCHKIKTKEDAGKLALKKRLNKANKI